VRPETDAVCEVGCATGKATLPLARRGFALTCVEFGPALAAEARRNLPRSTG
jgi:16S rRNA A1518/A1519 N6-dimethyltransferase RsmA/KsgA/DIM1 with predicted DNA glycosylase/AP lyase activity